MHRLFTIFALLIPVSCAGTNERPKGDDPEGLEIEREAEEVKDADKKFLSASKDEYEDFRRIWELYRKKDPRWPMERDRFKRRSEGAATLMSATFLKYYMEVNAQRSERARELTAIKSEIVAIGEPCAKFLVEIMVLDRIKRGDGEVFLTDDLTRQDCMEMLARMGSESVRELLSVYERDDVGVKGRRLTAKTLGGTKDRRVLAPLIKLMQEDPSWQVRADAATGLGLLGDTRAIPALNNTILKDEDKAVRKRAAKARRQIAAGGSTR